MPALFRYQTPDNVITEAPVLNLVAYTLLRVHTLKLINKSVKVKAEARFNALCITLADPKTESVRKALAGVKEKTKLIVDDLVESLAKLLAETLSETVQV